MNSKLIKLSESHYVIVDDSEIQEGCICVNLAHKMVVKPTDIQWAKSNKNNLKVITHSTEPIDGDNVGACFIKVKQLSMEQVEEIINGYSVIDKAQEIANLLYNEEAFNNKVFKGLLSVAYQEGFKAHQELEKDKLFTLENMQKSFKAGQLYCATEGKVYPRSASFEEHLKSLSPTEWEIDTSKIKL